MNKKVQSRRRRVVAVFAVALVIAAVAVVGGLRQSPADNNSTVSNSEISQTSSGSAAAALAKLAVKGRAPMTGYSRQQFGGDWADEGGCTMRDEILARDMTNVIYAGNTCEVKTGTLDDPYTGKIIQFVRGPGTSEAVEIDHVVALGDAWQTGAQALPAATRDQLYNDPLELLAVDGPGNEQKGDADAATWLPPNKAYRCRYVARQIAIKAKYHLWVTTAEHDAMQSVLNACPGQALPVVSQ